MRIGTTQLNTSMWKKSRASLIVQIRALQHQWVKVGVALTPMDEDEKEDHIHELHAEIADVHDLGDSQIIHIFDTCREKLEF